jgi:hypothetical protein
MEVSSPSFSSGFSLSLALCACHMDTGLSQFGLDSLGLTSTPVLYSSITVDIVFLARLSIDIREG